MNSSIFKNYIHVIADKYVQTLYCQSVRSLSQLGFAALQSSNESGEHVTEENQYDCLAHVVTPLWKVSYADQLMLKFEWSREVVKQITSRVRSRTTRKLTKHSTYFVDKVQPSPLTENYRNKDEFNIRTGIDGNRKTVGFFVGSPAKGSPVCVRGTYLINMKDSHKQVAQLYENYVRSSDLPACHDFQDGGHWRNLLVRSTNDGQLMLVAVFHPQNLPLERIEEESDKLKEYFVNGAGVQCNLTSLYFQACRHTRCTNDQAPFKLLHGNTHLTEELGGYKFQISPDSFFQVNTRAARVLYNCAIELAVTTPMTTLIDLCSGTGTISILASRMVRGAVGIESVYSAVVDARHNATVNSVHNVEFIPGRAEKKLRNILEELESSNDVIVVVNPGRSGLNPRVINTLCNCKQIQRVVYISCRADNPNTISNLVQLCQDGSFFSPKGYSCRYVSPHSSH